MSGLNQNDAASGQSGPSSVMNPAPSNPAPPSPYEHQKWVHELIRADAHRAHDTLDQVAHSINEATMESAQLAMRTAVLINGGAAVSVLAFVGGLVAQGKITTQLQFAGFAKALALSAVGVATATLTMGLAYLTNFCATAAASRQNKIWERPYTTHTASSIRYRRVYVVLIITSILLALCSLVFFVLGMLSVRSAVSHIL